MPLKETEFFKTCDTEGAKLPRLPFPMEEYHDRLEKIRKRMAEQGMDALILTKPDNIYYVSGYGASTIATSIGALHALVVPAKGEPRLLTRLLEKAAATETQWTKEPVLHSDDQDPFALLVEILRESGTTNERLGIEIGFLSGRQIERLKAVLPGAKLEDATGLVESVGVTLSQAEIGYVRKAAQVANIGFQAAVGALKEGVYIYEVVGEIHHAMYKAGQADLFAGSQVGRRTPWIGVWAGPQGGCMHETSTLKEIKKGDLVTIEIWSSYHHYSASAQGTVYVGDNPPAEVVDTYRMLSDMYVAVRDALKAGVTSDKPYEAANKIYRARHGVDYYRTIGFSMGLGTGDIRLFKGKEDLITPGLAFRVQAGLFTPLLIVICGTVMATEKGREELTKPLLELKMV